MRTIIVKCLDKKLGIAPGLRFSILENGQCIGNIFKVEEIVDNDTAIKVYSEMMLDSLPKKFRISDLISGIETNQIDIV